MKRIIWTEAAISLYERQLAAMESMGKSWLIHPDNNVHSKRVIHIELTTTELKALGEHS